MCCVVVVKEAMYIRSVLSFLEPGKGERTIVAHEDNVGAIHLANNPFSSSRSRHIDVRHHYVRRLVLENVVRVVYTCSKEQPADILTKPLDVESFNTHRGFLLNLKA